MSERRGPAAVPWAFLAMLGMVACAEWAIARHALQARSWVNWAWRQNANAARFEARKYQILCLGDSLVKFSLVPQVLDEATGRSSYNLALPSAQPAASFFLLRRALESGARPAAIVVDFMPAHLGRNHRDNLGQLAELRSWRDCLDEAWTARDPGFFFQVAVRRLLPAYQNRWEIREDVLCALRGEAASRPSRNLALLLHWRKNRGAQVLPRNPALGGDPNRLLADIQAGSANLCPPNWVCDPVNERYIERFLALCTARGIPVFWLLPPALSEVQARREQNGLDARYARLVARMQGQFPDLIVLDARHAGYSLGVFFDVLHLDRRGAAALSHDVAQAVRRGLEAPVSGAKERWVALPVFRDVPRDLALEDTTQTTLAVLELQQRRMR